MEKKKQRGSFPLFFLASLLLIKTMALFEDPLTADLPSRLEREEEEAEAAAGASALGEAPLVLVRGRERERQRETEGQIGKR